MADDFAKEKRVLADVFLENRPKELYGQQSFWIVLRYCKYVFGQFNSTKNRGACVDDIIWLVNYNIGQINFIIDQANQLIFV
jgi:hypothetical protein